MGLLRQPLHTKSVVERIVDQITNAIIQGELRPGDRLPTELELAELFGVGRNSVREAIKILAAFGVVHIRRSEGTFVCDTFRRGMLDPMLYGILLQCGCTAQIVELRQIFDNGILQMAILKADHSDLEQMQQALRALEAAAYAPEATPEQMLRADLQLHTVITRSTGNPMIEQLADYIARITIPSRTETMRTLLHEGRQDAFVQLHRALVDTVATKDSRRVAAVVDEHYQYWKQTGQ